MTHADGARWPATRPGGRADCTERGGRPPSSAFSVLPIFGASALRPWLTVGSCCPAQDCLHSDSTRLQPRQRATVSSLRGRRPRAAPRAASAASIARLPKVGPRNETHHPSPSLPTLSRRVSRPRAPRPRVHTAAVCPVYRAAPLNPRSHRGKAPKRGCIWKGGLKGRKSTQDRNVRLSPCQRGWIGARPGPLGRVTLFTRL